MFLHTSFSPLPWSFSISLGASLQSCLGQQRSKQALQGSKTTQQAYRSLDTQYLIHLGEKDKVGQNNFILMKVNSTDICQNYLAKSRNLPANDLCRRPCLRSCNPYLFFKNPFNMFHLRRPSIIFPGYNGFSFFPCLFFLYYNLSHLV